eukprot:scaffold64422_cov18-Tisochrysis_lutea.AAC.2
MHAAKGQHVHMLAWVIRCLIKVMVLAVWCAGACWCGTSSAWPWLSLLDARGQGAESACLCGPAGAWSWFHGHACLVRAGEGRNVRARVGQQAHGRMEAGSPSDGSAAAGVPAAGVVDDDNMGGEDGGAEGEAVQGMGAGGASGASGVEPATGSAGRLGASHAHLGGFGNGGSGGVGPGSSLPAEHVWEQLQPSARQQQQQQQQLRPRWRTPQVEQGLWPTRGGCGVFSEMRCA